LIDANGILSVTATDKGSGTKADIKITGASTLAKEDVERMVNEAEKYAEDDTKKREIIDTKNQADSVVYQSRKQLSELAAKLQRDVQDQVEKKIVALEEAIKTDDVKTINTSMDELKQEVMKMGAAMYEPQETDSGETQATKDTQDYREKGEGEGVIDADFTYKK
jgi:molecular chaperone DnaK (HSP70)